MALGIPISTIQYKDGWKKCILFLIGGIIETIIIGIIWKYFLKCCCCSQCQYEFNDFVIRKATDDEIKSFNPNNIIINRVNTTNTSELIKNVNGINNDYTQIQNV